MNRLAILLLVAPVLCSAVIGSVHVTGRLVCNNAPYSGEAVRVMEYNNVGKDTLMNQDVTDNSGYFSIKASITDWFSVDPYIYIPNYCGSVVVGSEQCTQSCLKINVPQSFVTGQHVPLVTYDIGTVELLNLEHGEQFNLAKVIFGKWQECRQR